jgi:hypothetical protein
MSIYQNQNRRKSRLARLEIVGQLYRRHYSNRAIQREVMARLNLKTYSHLTVQRDIQYLLAEWRKARIENTELLVQGELAQIDECVRELWDQWDKSKEDYKKQQQRDFGKPDSSIGFGDKKRCASHHPSAQRWMSLGLAMFHISRRYASSCRKEENFLVYMRLKNSRLLGKTETNSAGYHKDRSH